MDLYPIDKTPPPIQRPSLKASIIALQVEESFLATGRSPGSVKTTVSNLKGAYPDRKFITRETREGPRVWRTA